MSDMVDGIIENWQIKELPDGGGKVVVGQLFACTHGKRNGYPIHSDLIRGQDGQFIVTQTAIYQLGAPYAGINAEAA